jgi:hypothetical protein
MENTNSVLDCYPENVRGPTEHFGNQIRDWRPSPAAAGINPQTKAEETDVATTVNIQDFINLRRSPVASSQC